LRYPDTRTITFGAGVTGTESSPSGGYKTRNNYSWHRKCELVIMAHYAFLDKDNAVVTEVIAGIDETELIEGLDT
jgi:hypothetical protein